MPWNENDTSHERYEHPSAQHFGGDSEMKLVHMSQKASTSLPKGRKTAPIANPLIAPALPNTDRAGMASVYDERRVGKGDALVLRFRKEGDEFIYDVNGTARIVVRRLKNKDWIGKLQTRVPLRIIPEYVDVKIIPAHIEPKMQAVFDETFTPRLEEVQVFVRQQRIETVVPEHRVGGKWEDAFHGFPGVSPIVAARSLAHQCDWLYVHGDRRSLMWWYRSVIILGLSKGDTLPKKRFTYRIQPVPDGTWVWELVPKLHIPHAVLPDNTGMVRTPDLLDIRNELSLHANGDYDEAGTIDGKLKKSKRTKAFKYETSAKNVQIRKRYESDVR